MSGRTTQKKSLFLPTPVCFFVVVSLVIKPGKIILIMISHRNLAIDEQLSNTKIKYKLRYVIVIASVKKLGIFRFP